MELTSAANHTKWEEGRLAMYGLSRRPAFRRTYVSGNCDSPDREWFYHFRLGGYADTLFVDILVDDEEQRADVLQALKSIHVAGDMTDTGFRVYGYAEPGQTLNYL